MWGSAHRLGRAPAICLDGPVTQLTPEQAPRFASDRSSTYGIIVAAFCSLLLISNIAATKGITFTVPVLGDINTDGGFILFPLTYIIGDVLSEVYGLKATRRAIAMGFVMSALASLTFLFVIKMPGSAFYENQDSFEAVLGPVWQIVVASLAGFAVGQFLNSYVLVKIKERTHEKHLWARLLGSTVVGEFFDTLIFCSIAAGVIGITTGGDFVNYVFYGFIYKCAVEVVLLPVTYRVIAWMKKRENYFA